MVFFHLFFHKKRWGRQGFGEDSPAGRGKCHEVTKGDGARARGLSRPQRRDLAGPIDHISGEACGFKYSRSARAGRKFFYFGNTESISERWFGLCRKTGLQLDMMG